MKPMNRVALALIAIVGISAMAPGQVRADDDQQRAQQAADREAAERAIEAEGEWASGAPPDDSQVLGGPGGPGGPEQRDGFHGRLGGGVAIMPDYEGSSDYKVMPFPMFSLRYGWGERYVALEGASLKANLMSDAGFEFGPLLAYEMGRNDDMENRAVRRLGEIDGTVMAGAFFSTEIDIGGQGPGLQFSGQLLSDVGGNDQGVVATLETGYGWMFGESWMLTIGASTTWADENYMQTYFGVTPAGALASGLPVYNADAGFKNVELSTALMYRIDEDWSLMARASYGRLLDSAADSPIVQNGGSEDQLGFVLGVGWEF